MGDNISPDRSEFDKKLSIIIVNWNTLDLLIQCLDSIYNAAPEIKLETFVVDNASTDGSVVAVRELYTQVQLIANTENVGFARANNQAISQATGRYILLLNPDTLVIPGALETLFEFMDQRTDAGAVGARILNPDRTLQTSCYPALTLSREFWRLMHLDVVAPYGIYRMNEWTTDTPRRVDSVLGACLMIRREVISRIGLLDPDYFFTAEEIDLCRRICKGGWHIYWVPRAQIIHYGGQSSKLAPAKSFLHLYHGKVLYFRKQHGALAAMLYKLVLFMTTLLRLLISPLAWLERRSRREQHLILASRYCQLLRALPGL
ncbi:MAG: glycosyltransferase family 2 protein [Chloroflexi bacterium]|nr:glycosyltransferase family 2 protein [Chloroflexota bacterium]MCL5274936.1 glycosyltransferase family 2 protein [Chloroflexota bacterium]